MGGTDRRALRSGARAAEIVALARKSIAALFDAK
jgi:hypothetical protein